MPLYQKPTIHLWKHIKNGILFSHQNNVIGRASMLKTNKEQTQTNEDTHV